MEWEHDAAVPMGREALAVARRSGDGALVRITLDLVAQNAYARGDFAAAIAYGRELVTSIEASQFRAAVGLAFGHLSNALLATHEIDGALDCARKSVPLCVADGMLWTRLDALALLALRRGRLPEAARIAGRSSAIDQRRSSRREPNGQRARVEVMAAFAGRVRCGGTGAFTERGREFEG